MAPSLKALGGGRPFADRPWPRSWLGFSAVKISTLAVLAPASEAAASYYKQTRWGVTTP